MYRGELARPGHEISGGNAGYPFEICRQTGRAHAERASADSCSYRDSSSLCVLSRSTKHLTNAPMVRRQTKIINDGKAPVGIDFLSSAMLHGLADPQHFDNELRFHPAVNSWMAEGQWHTFKPSELGFIENERTSWSEASADSVGCWSTEKYLPMAIVENTRLGLVWFWQIEHDGSWYWEISNVSSRGQLRNDVYAYLGGPDDLHSDAWKNLQPGQTYGTVPVAIGCVKGDLRDAVEAITVYRRKLCKRPRRTATSAPSSLTTT